MNRDRLLQVYIAALTASAAAIVAISVWSFWHSPPSNTWILIEFAALVPLGWFCSNQRVYFTESSFVLLGTITQIATIIVLPLPLAILAACGAKIVSQVHRQVQSQSSTKRTLVNIGSTVLTVALAAVLFDHLGGPDHLWHTDSLTPILAFPALAAMGAAYLLSDSLYVAIAITLSTRDRFVPILLKLSRDTLPPDLSLVAVGIVFSTLLHFSPILSFLIIIPVYLSVRSFAAVARLREETEKSVMQLAKSVDMRDTGTGVHSQQLEQAAKRLAGALALIPEHVHEIGLAARAHDLGKIELPDAILLKRGPLTAEERTAMQEHANIGARMLESYSAFSRSLAYVKHHHERWDGKGYPDGLKGEEIPLGARIITVVDSYDAMVADRPYRDSLGVQEAVSRLKAGMGTQFDPKICAAWIQILIEDGTYVPTEPVHILQALPSEAKATG